MKKLMLTMALGAILFSSISIEASSSCLSIKILTDKLDNDIKVKNELEASIYLSEKLKDASKWNEFLNIKEKSQAGESEIESTIFSANEIDVLLLIDALNETKSDITRDLTFNGLTIASSVAMTFATTKIVNKLMSQGYKKGFMVRIQKMINSPDRIGKVNKLLHLSNVLALVTPAYLGYKEYTLYNMLKEVRNKIDVLEELSQSLPELDILEERIENDKIRLMQMRASLNCY